MSDRDGGAPMLGWGLIALLVTAASATEMTTGPAPTEPPTPFPSDWTPAPTDELLALAWERIDLRDYEGARLVAEQAAARRDAREAEALAAIGAAFEADNDPASALPFYERALHVATDPVLLDHLAFRIAEAHGTLGRYDDANLWLDQLGDEPRAAEDTLKIALLRAIWDIRSDGATKKELRRVARLLDDAPPDAVTFYRAKAHAVVARALCDHAAALSLDTGRERRAVRHLDARARYILAAERQVVAAITLREPEWGLEGLLVLGQAYERVADDMLAMPVPASLRDADQVALYRATLAERVEVVYLKARNHYAQGLELAHRLQWRSSRVGRLEAAEQAVRGKIEALSS